ncbi:MAG TPA: ferritin-like domain-containing protein [Solirubrobacteraceae bacterium]
MSFRIRLDETDRDGAIAESLEAAVVGLEREGDTRADFLRRVRTAGVALSGGAMLGGLGGGVADAASSTRPPASFGKGDVGILNFALTLEYLESAFYNGAAVNLTGLDPQTATFLAVAVFDENRHVKKVRSTVERLGGKPVAKPTFDFNGANTLVTSFLETAFALENTGVHAYAGQAANLKDPAVAATALSIITVEARHTAAVATILNSPGYRINPNGAFDDPYTASRVLAAVKAAGFIAK